MKKQLFYILVIFVLINCLESCTTIEDSPEGFIQVRVEPTFNEFFSDTTKYQTTVTKIDGEWYEFGNKFTPLKNGVITKFASKMPRAGNYRVVLWDFDSKSLLTQTVVYQNQDNIWAWENIPEFSIQTNRSYIISIFSNNWSDFYRKTFEDLQYPILTKNIKVLSFAYTPQHDSQSLPLFPNHFENVKTISGLIDFGFVPDN